MRTGILGGSFNPVHQQHLHMAHAAMLAQQLEEVWFVPVFKPVHKPDVSLLAYQQRLSLLRLALSGQESLKVCEVEKDLGGPSYTINTIEFLKESFPDRAFFLLIGGDSLRDLPTWREIGRLKTMCEFIVIERPGFLRVSPVTGATISWADCTPSAVSATHIRAQLKAGIFNDLGLDHAVLWSILRHNYYDCLDSMSVAALHLIEQRCRLLPDGLIKHIEGVGRLAVKYALNEKVEPRHALIAGLAHDLFRIAAAEEILGFAASGKSQLSDSEINVPMLAHGAAAAGFLLHSGLGLPDAVLAAIRDHTFPQKDAPILTQILAVADTLEPSRGIASRDLIREAGLSFARMFQEVLQIKADCRKAV